MGNSYANKLEKFSAMDSPILKQESKGALAAITTNKEIRQMQSGMKEGNKGLTQQKTEERNQTQFPSRPESLPLIIEVVSVLAISIHQYSFHPMGNNVTTFTRVAICNALK